MALSANMKLASRTLALLAVFFAGRVSLAEGTGNCPGTYVEYSSTCFKFVTTIDATRAQALTNCRADQNGWLATLDDTAVAAGVTTFFDMATNNKDVYFGLYKTTDCTSTCVSNNLLRWEARTGETPSTTGYTANMKS